MAAAVNNSKTSTSSSNASASGASSLSPSVFFPMTDPTSGTWLSLGSYEEVLNSDFDYWAIHKALKDAGMTLVKVLKIHNKLLKERFDEELELLKKRKNPGFDPNIQFLYHGTNESIEKICHEGLDERVATAEHFGRGIYFSNSPQVCRIRSEVNSPQQPFIVRCRVMLGDSKVYSPGSSDPTLTREPVKQTVDGKNIFFDSVQGKPGDFTQYAVYEKRRALVEHIILYTASGPPPSLPPVPQVGSRSSRKKRRSRSRERRSSVSSQDNDRKTSVPRKGSRKSSVSSMGSRNSSRDRSASPVTSRHSSDSGGSRRGSLDEGESPLRGATGGFDFCKRTSVSGDEDFNKASESAKKEGASAEATQVPKVFSVRQKTRRLMSANETAPESVAASSTPAPEAAAASVASPPLAHVNNFKKEEQEKALKQMLNLKGRVSDNNMKELWRCFSETYGVGGQSSFAPDDYSAPSSEDDDAHLVLDSLITEFQQVCGNVDRDLARDIIIQNDMDINNAISAYLDM